MLCLVYVYHIISYHRLAIIMVELKGIRSVATFSLHNSISELASRYDAFILDQFGVMHNGAMALPGALECVHQLKKQGKRLIILSNTSASSETALSRLPKLGFDPKDFCGAVTSGEESSRYIATSFGNDPNGAKRALWLTWDAQNSPSADPSHYMKKCGNIELATSVDEADFVITHGSQVWLRPTDQLSLGSFMSTGNLNAVEPILQQCQARQLPMICANGDFTARLADGSLGHMPGASCLEHEKRMFCVKTKHVYFSFDIVRHVAGKIARRYEEIGGNCKYFGKPMLSSFEACLRELGLSKDRSRVVHVGDSLHHDIRGANDANIASIFVTGGIHAEELDADDVGFLPSQDALAALFQKEGHTPTHVIPLFRF